MGWTKLVLGAACLGLALAPIGCGGAEQSAGNDATAGAAMSGGGSSGAATAGHGSGGTATSGGSASSSAGMGATSSAAGGPANIFVDGLRGREGCLPRPLPVASAGDGLEAGQVRCAVGIVTFAPSDCACDATQKLEPASLTFAAAIANNMKTSGVCGGTTGVDCSRVCACELVQCSGAALTQCQTDTTPIGQLPPGFCYVDAVAVPPLGDPALVATCPADLRRELRILGPAPAEPAPLMYLGCW